MRRQFTAVPFPCTTLPISVLNLSERSIIGTWGIFLIAFFLSIAAIVHGLVWLSRGQSSAFPARPQVPVGISSFCVPGDESGHLGRMGEIDEMTAVWDDLVRLNPGKWDHVIAAAVNLMDGTVDPRWIPPTQNHGCLPTDKADRHVLAHLQDELTMLPTDPLRSRHQPGCRLGQRADDGIRKQLGGPEESPVPPGNRGRTPATADQDHVPAVASGRHLTGQHPAERCPTQDAGPVAEN